MGSSVRTSSENQDNRQAATDNAWVAGVSGDNSTLGLATLSGISGAGDVVDNKAGLFKDVQAGTFGYNSNSGNTNHLTTTTTTNVTDGGAFDLVGSVMNRAVDLSRDTTSGALAAMINYGRDNAAYTERVLNQATDTVRDLTAQQMASISNLTAQQTASAGALADGVLSAAAQISNGLNSSLSSLAGGLNSSLSGFGNSLAGGLNSSLSGFGNSLAGGLNSSFSTFTDSLNKSSSAQGDQAKKNQELMRWGLIIAGVGLAIWLMRKN